MNIYCFSTLSFAKLQFKSVINKAFHKHGVASFTDAWIETLIPILGKLAILVASFTDAWIETIGANKRQKRAMSHLLQMRGLKLMRLRLLMRLVMSHLLQMRGLKHTKDVDNRIQYQVASFTDAWIETAIPYHTNQLSCVASFTDAWIETLKYSRSFIQLPSHLLQMRGLKQD